MVDRDKLDCVPLFLGELADDIFVCGKTINLLKLCCPEVCLFQVVVFAPSIIHVFFCSSYGVIIYKPIPSYRPIYMYMYMYTKNSN